MATGTQVITEAKKYVGDGGKRFCDAYGSGMVNWCCIFVWYVMRQAGASKLFCDGQKVAWVPTAQEWLASHGTKVSLKDARAGDVVVFTWGGGSRDHIGFVVKGSTGATFETIEGNTGSSNYNTSKVMIRERHKDNVYGIYRPKYAQEAKTVSIGEVRKYKCLQPAHVYKSHSISSGKVETDTTAGSVYHATKWYNEWIYVPYLKGWVPTTGSGGVYLERIPKIRYVVTNKTGVNVYKDHSTKSTKIENVKRGSYLTITKWYGRNCAWGYAPSVSGWVAVSCLTEYGAGTRFFRELQIIEDKFVAAGMRYTIHNLPKTLDGALKSKTVDCAHYVSFGLQAMSYLPKGTYFWLNQGINGDSKAIQYLKTSGKFKISYPDKYWNQLDLRIGDIVGYGYTVSGKEGQHTQVYAGRDGSGNPLWYSAGTSDVKAKSYGPKRKAAYESRPINVLIRPL